MDNTSEKILDDLKSYSKKHIEEFDIYSKQAKNENEKKLIDSMIVMYEDRVNNLISRCKKELCNLDPDKKETGILSIKNRNESYIKSLQDSVKKIIIGLLWN